MAQGGPVAFRCIHLLFDIRVVDTLSCDRAQTDGWAPLQGRREADKPRMQRLYCKSKTRNAPVKRGCLSAYGNLTSGEGEVSRNRGLPIFSGCFLEIPNFKKCRLHAWKEPSTDLREFAKQIPRDPRTITRVSRTRIILALVWVPFEIR